MPQADNVISFPVDGTTTDFLMDFIGTPQGRLDEIVQRLGGLSATLFLLKELVEEDSPLAAASLGLLDTVVRDCLRIAELRPVQVVAA